jgi:hypothetical protein
MQTQKKTKNVGTDQQVSIEAINDIGGVRNEKHLEAG